MMDLLLDSFVPYRNRLVEAGCLAEEVAIVCFVGRKFRIVYIAPTVSRRQVSRMENRTFEHANNSEE